MLKRNLSRAEVAKLLAVKEQTVAKWACLGRGPRFFKRRHRVFYRRDDVLAWIDDPEQHETEHHEQREAAGMKM
jgi:DNA-directed RNA polymerase specialized sigma subunit